MIMIIIIIVTIIITRINETTVNNRTYFLLSLSTNECVHQNSNTMIVRVYKHDPTRIREFLKEGACVGQEAGVHLGEARELDEGVFVRVELVVGVWLVPCDTHTQTHIYTRLSNASGQSYTQRRSYSKGS